MASIIITDWASMPAVPITRPYCYVELAVSSLAVAKIIDSTHCAYPVSQRDGQAEYVYS